MKKIFSSILTSIMIFSLSACGTDTSQNQLPDLSDEIIPIDNSMTNASSTYGTEIIITVGDKIITAELDDSDTARQFVDLLPQTISMTRGRERVYYGRINKGSLDYNAEDIVVDAENGDLAYWFSGNSLSLFFNVTEGNSDVNSGIVVFGKITSDLSELYEMSGSETMLVSLATDETWETESQLESGSSEIALTIGDTIVTAELYDNDISRQFVDLLPQTISMTRGRDREYYGDIDGSLNYDEDDIQTTAEDGDLAYWFSGNSLAFFFNITENNSDVNSGIVVFGKITSDISVFDNIDSSTTVEITLID